MRRANVATERPKSSRLGTLLCATALIGLVAIPFSASAQNQTQSQAGKQSGTDIPTHVTEEATVVPEEETGILEAPAHNPRRVYVADQDNFNVINRIYAIDGEQGKLLGMLDGGMLVNVNLMPDDGRIVVSNTLFERVSRGARNDFIEIWDPKTLSVTQEIDIPEERFLLMPMDAMSQITPDGQFLLYYRFSPAPGVGIVDLQNNKHITTVDVPDCYFVMPTAPDRFYMHCRGGSLLKVAFTRDGETKTTESKPFHPPEQHIYDHPLFSAKTGKAYFISYDGTVYPADLSGEDPQFGQSWSMFSDQERQENWRPGGWQVAAYHTPTNQIYVLVRQGGEFTHANPSKEVWVYDANNGKRLKKIPLENSTNSIAISQDQNPLLFALDTHHSTLEIYDTGTGQRRSSIPNLGVTPHIVVTSSGS